MSPSKIREQNYVPLKLTLLVRTRAGAKMWVNILQTISGNTFSYRLHIIGPTLVTVDLIYIQSLSVRPSELREY